MVNAEHVDRDPYDAPVRKNEAGGIYATGTIGRTYTRGQIIKV